MKTAKRIIAKLFGTTSDEVYASWQNLNEDRLGNVKGWPYHGRAWLRVGHGGKALPRCARFSWNLWSHFCGAQVTLSSDSEDTLLLHVAMPPVSLWLSFEGSRALEELAALLAPGEKYAHEQKRELSWSIHNGAVWWLMWMNPDSSSSTDPRWRRGNFNVADFVRGKTTHSKRNEVTHNVGIPMPEGVYPATVKMYDAVWTHRFGEEVVRRGEANIDIGIPFEGKGENSWDCGEDATYGLTTTADRPEQVIAGVVESVLRERRKHSGGLMAKYPPPAERAAAHAARMKAAAGVVAGVVS